MRLECRVCGGRVEERCCNGCGRVMTSAELMLAAPPLDPRVIAAEKDGTTSQ